MNVVDTVCTARLYGAALLEKEGVRGTRPSKSHDRFIPMA
jgi:hypothetical protein